MASYACRQALKRCLAGVRWSPPLRSTCSSPGRQEKTTFSPHEEAKQKQHVQDARCVLLHQQLVQDGTRDWPKLKSTIFLSFLDHEQAQIGRSCGSSKLIGARSKPRLPRGSGDRDVSHVLKGGGMAFGSSKSPNPSLGHRENK